MLARLTVRLRSSALDRALIHGANPAASPRLAARAAQLTSPRARAEIAAGLDRLVAAAKDGPGRVRVSPDRAAILANERQLHALAARLREPGPLYAQGIAIIRELLADGTGPAYAQRPGTPLSHQLQHASAALRGGC
jgi:hypothetical protein